MKRVLGMSASDTHAIFHDNLTHRNGKLRLSNVCIYARIYLFCLRGEPCSSYILWPQVTLGTKDVIYGPLRLGQSHWTLVYIDQRTKPCNFTFIDPLGSSTEEGRGNNFLVKWLRYVAAYNKGQLAARKYLQLGHNNVTYKAIGHAMQADNTTCGAWTMVVSIIKKITQ